MKRMQLQSQSIFFYAAAGQPPLNSFLCSCMSAATARFLVRCPMHASRFKSTIFRPMYGYSFAHVLLLLFVVVAQALCSHLVMHAKPREDAIFAALLCLFSLKPQ